MRRAAVDRDRLDRDPRVAPARARRAPRSRRMSSSASGRALLELDPRVEVLGVLADDDEVDVVVAGAHARVGLAGPHRHVEVELLAERHVHGAEAAADRRRDRALERDLGPPDRLERRGRAAGCRRTGPSRRRRPPGRPSRTRRPSPRARGGWPRSAPGPMPSPGINVTSCATGLDSTERYSARVMASKPAKKSVALSGVAVAETAVCSIDPERGILMLPRLRHRRSRRARDVRGGRLPPARGRAAERGAAARVQGGARAA